MSRNRCRRKKEILTLAQAEQLGTDIGKAQPDVAKVVKYTNVQVEGGEACKRLIKGIVQAAK